MNKYSFRSKLVNASLLTLMFSSSYLSAGLKEDMLQIAGEVRSNLEKAKAGTHGDPTQQDGRNYYAFAKETLPTLDYIDLKDQLSQKMGLKSKKMIQLVGDSTKFTEQGTAEALQFVAPFFEGDHLIEYGFTGYLTEDRKILDANSLLNAWVEDHPNQAHRVLANVVGHTMTALEKWGCIASSKVKHFVLVNNEFGADLEGQNRFTKFGDDVLISDNIMSAKDNDILVMVEGGVQSFKQAINVMKNDVPVKAFLGVRTDENRLFFSASEFLNRFKKHFSGRTDITDVEAGAFMDTYLTERKGWNPANNDASTKAKLFADAKADFISSGVFKKVNDLVEVTLAPSAKL